MNSTHPSLFAAVPPFPGDAILALMEEFQGDRRREKVSLSIGVCFDDDGHLPTLNSVRDAEAALLGQERPRGYLPMEGLASYREAVQRLLFGASHEALRSGRIVTVQTLGGPAP